MFSRFRRGKREKTRISRAMERKTPSAIRAGSGNPASSRLRIAMRRRRGTARSNMLTQPRANGHASQSGPCSRQNSTARVSRYSTRLAVEEPGGTPIFRLFDPAAAQDQFATVEHRALAWGDCALRLVEDYFYAVRIRCGDEGGYGCPMLVANFNFGPDRAGDRGRRDPVHFVCRQAWPQQFVVASDDYPLGCRFGRDHIERLACRNAEPAPLAHREVVCALVLAENPAAGVHDFALCALALNALLVEIGIDETGIVAVRDETDLLAVGLFGNGHIQRTGQLANLRFVVSAQRE